VYGNECSAKSARRCPVISNVSEFADGVQAAFESVLAKVSKEAVNFKQFEKDVHCLIENLDDFKSEAVNKPVKVGFRRVYDQYNALEDDIYSAVKAFNDFLKLRNYENGRIFIEEAGRVPTVIQRILDLFNGRIAGTGNLLVGMQYILAETKFIFFILIQCQLDEIENDVSRVKNTINTGLWLHAVYNGLTRSKRLVNRVTFKSRGNTSFLSLAHHTSNKFKNLTMRRFRRLVTYQRSAVPGRTYLASSLTCRIFLIP
jgi:hypothetical protein